MAEKGGGGGFGPFFILLFVIVLLTVLGGTTGGGDNTPSDNTGSETNNPSGNQSLGAQDSGPGTGALGSEINTLVGTHSGLFGQISLFSGNLYANDSSQEYLELDAISGASNKILLTGMEIRSSISGQSALIGKGVYRPFFSSGNVEDPIYLNPGDKVYLVTGKSPVGYSFRANKCTGYFAQFHDFSPYLPSECPDASSYGYPGVPIAYKNACYDYIDSLSSCSMPLNFVPDDIGPDCTSYVTSKLNYDTCVDRHASDTDFYKPLWFVYLNHDDTMWGSRREFIKLSDQNKNAVNYLDLR